MFKIREARHNIGQFLCMLALSTTSVAHGQSLLGKFVVVGDSLSAGFQNFSLFDDTNAVLFGVPYVGGQKWGYAAQLATQAHTDLNLPLITWPGVPVSIGSNGTAPGVRENTTQQTLDLSVPGYLLADALGRVVDTSTFTSPNVNVIDVMAFDVLAYPSVRANNPFSTCGVMPLSSTMFFLSAATCAVQQRPETLILWIGNNDALQALTTGTPPTDSLVFAAQYDLLLGMLKASGARIVIANVPDVTHLPFLMQCSDGTYYVPNLANPPADPTQACSVGTGTGQFIAISPSLVTQAHNAVLAYNATISTEAHNFGATFVDVYSVFENVYNRKGYTLGSSILGNGPGGGLFSLDLIHPTNTAYAILANSFISAMNTAIQQGNTQIPLVCVNTVASADLLAPLTPAQRQSLAGSGCLQ
jgi:hypothetical protein